MAFNFKSSFNLAWLHFFGTFSILLAFLLGGLQLLLQGISDPLHCNALLSRGSWLDSSHKNWQPDGCMLYTYKEKEASSCLKSQDIIFIGDSITRQLFFQVAKTLDSSLPGAPHDNQKHADYSFETKYGTNITFAWDPFLNGSYTQWLLSESQGSLANYYGATPPPAPAMLVLGSGLWYLRYANQSGGIASWESNIERIFKTLSTQGLPADSVVFLPVEQVITSKLSTERAQTMHPSDIEAMNSDLHHRINPSKNASKGPANVHLPLVFNQMVHEALTDDGLHFDDSLLRIQANILLNLRCNDKMPKVFPFSKTCCSSYPRANLLQFIFLSVVLLSGPYIYYTVFSSSRGGSWYTHIFSPYSMPPLIISATIGLIYTADRTGFWSKEQKQFDAWSFSILCLISLGIGLLTIKKADSDLGILNREQTDEWKGWMQIAILIYHYFGASKISGIYNPIRLLVASYLFMTGYGHATFYLKKADFGFLRVAQVLIRLNLFTILLAYTMNTQYVAYYFTPLVTMWYIVVYATMLVGARFNDRTPILLVKIFLSATFMTWFMNGSWLLEMSFDILHRFFAIRWSMREWMFRTNLDIWIVYIGMLTALAVIKAREHRLTDRTGWQLAVKISVGVSALVFLWFFVFELMQESKFTYNAWHPYISPLPVLAFVVLRNSSTVMRSAHSEAFAFFGRCSLEAFIIQYHLWLAADTKGVLTIIPGTHWRPVNFLLITVIFVVVCERVAFATGEITNVLTERQSLQPLPSPVTTNTLFQAPDEDDDDESAQEIELPERSLDPSYSCKDDAANAIPIEPDTPIRPQRWVNDIANTTSEPSRARNLRAWVASNNWIFGPHLRILAIVVALWVFNIFWTYPEDIIVQ